MAIRSFVDALVTSKEDGLDDFDTTRILESSFNRLFLSVEHLINAMMLKEKGNYSKKHFGDFDKMKEFKEKYDIDLATSYQTTYSFRSYGDYRKFPEVKEEFDKAHLNEQINNVKAVFELCFGILEKEDKFKEIVELFNERVQGVNGGVVKG